MQSRRCPLLLVACFTLLTAATPVLSQQEPLLVPPERYPFDQQLQQLQFSAPTTIRGRVRFFDSSDGGLWLDWDAELAETPSGGRRWERIEGNYLVVFYPKDIAQREQIRSIPPGRVLQLVVQQDDQGRRRILFFDELTDSPKLPL